MKSEDSIQIEFMNWCNWLAKFHNDRWYLVHHIPNGGNRNPKEARKFKMMGVTAGIPDVFIPFMRAHSINGKITEDSIYCGMYIEFKNEKGRLSKEQKNIIPLLEDEGFKVVVCRSAKEAVREVEKYMGEELPKREQDL
jgi:hypothetical protein